MSEHSAMPKQWVFCCLWKRDILLYHWEILYSAGSWVHEYIIHLQCLSTLPYPQPSRSFTMAMPIGWLPSVTEMRFFSLTASRDDLPSTLEEQIAAVYANFCSKDGLLTITKVGVQQQKGMADCGLFAIAFAYHSARWRCCKAWIRPISYATTPGLPPISTA